MKSKTVVIYLSLILAASVAVRLYGLRDRGLYFPDETRYYRYAAEGCKVLRLEGFKPAMRFASDTFTAKPGHTMLGILWMSVFGASPYSAVLINIFFGLLSIFLVFIVGRDFYSEAAGLLGAAILAVSALHAYYCRSFMSHIDQVFFIMAAFYCYAMPFLRQRGFIVPRFLSGLFLGAAFSIHPTTTVYIAAFLFCEIILLFADKSRALKAKAAGAIVFFTAAALVPLLFFISNSSYFTRLLWLVNEARLVVTQRGSPPVPFMLSRVIPVYEGWLFFSAAIASCAYFIYRVIKRRRPIDMLILVMSLGIFLYWEFFSVHQRFSRQVLPAIPFFCISIGALIDDMKFNKAALVSVLILSGLFFTGRMIAGTRNHYSGLQNFINTYSAKSRVVTTSEYLAGTSDILMPGLKAGVTWFKDKKEIDSAVNSGQFDFLIIYPSDWLAHQEFRFKTKPSFMIPDPQNSYFAEFYEALCFTNRLDLLRYRAEKLSYSIGAYKTGEGSIN